MTLSSRSLYNLKMKQPGFTHTSPEKKDAGQDTEPLPTEKKPSHIEYYMSFPQGDGSFNADTASPTFVEKISILSFSSKGDDTYEVYINTEKSVTKSALQFSKNLKPLFDELTQKPKNPKTIQIVEPAVVKREGDRFILISKGILTYNNAGIKPEEKITAPVVTATPDTTGVTAPIQAPDTAVTTNEPAIDTNDPTIAVKKQRTPTKNATPEKNKTNTKIIRTKKGDGQNVIRRLKTELKNATTPDTKGSEPETTPNPEPNPAAATEPESNETEADREAARLLVVEQERKAAAIKEQEAIFDTTYTEYAQLLKEIDEAEQELAALEAEEPIEDEEIDEGETENSDKDTIEAEPLKPIMPWDREDITIEELNTLIDEKISELNEFKKALFSDSEKIENTIDKLGSKWFLGKKSKKRLQELRHSLDWGYKKINNIDTEINKLYITSSEKRQTIREKNEKERLEKEKLANEKEKLEQQEKIKAELPLIAADAKEKPFLYYAAAKVTDPYLSTRLMKYGVVDLRWVENNTADYRAYKFFQTTNNNEGFFELNIFGFKMVLKNSDALETEDENGNPTGIRSKSPEAIYKITGPDGTIITDNIQGYTEAKQIFVNAAENYKRTLQEEFDNLNK